MANLHDQRQVYEKAELLENTVKTNPMEQFRDWYLEAAASPAISEANAMAVSTLEPDGCPRTRMVLLKSYDAEGFVFFTNYNSRKGIALDKTGKACLSFFWPALERQIIMKTNVEHLAENLSDGYFHSRPKGSQLGALASPQSQVVPNREFLENEVLKLEKIYEDKDVPRPKNWGGIMARPYEIEFWQGRPNRLHDRILYTLQDNYDWKIERLAP